MFMHNGGTAVAKGLYWSPVDGGRIYMRDNGILPGDRSRGYLRMSPVILLVVAPLLGMSFIFFLPFFGIGVMVVLCLLSIGGALSAVANTALRVCCSRARRGVESNRAYTRAYRPLRASFTGSLKSRKGGRPK